MNDTAESRLKKTLFIVEATSNEVQGFWRDHAKENTFNPNPHYTAKVTWEQMDGWLVTVGHYTKRPVCISVMFNKLDGHIIMFWEPTSQLVDHKMIDKWLEKNFTGTYDKGYRRASCDASNFGHCLSAIRDANKLK